MKKISVLIEDDFELMGNGTGNVAYHQYLPAIFFMNLAKKLDIKVSFMVEVLQQLAYKKFETKSRSIKQQADLWGYTVQEMKNKGFDVNLHLHPQWYQAEFNGDFFFLSDKWNIGQYNSGINIIGHSFGHHLIKL